MKRARSLGDIGDGVSLMLSMCVLVLLMICPGGRTEMSSDPEHTLDPSSAGPDSKFQCQNQESGA